MGLQPALLQNALQVVQLPLGPGQNPDLAERNPWALSYPCPIPPFPYKPARIWDGYRQIAGVS